MKIPNYLAFFLKVVCLAIVLFLLAFIVTMPCRAQEAPNPSGGTNTVTNPIPNNPLAQNFIQQTIGYFASINTNLDLAGTSLILSIGACYEQNVNFANYVAVEYDLGKFNIDGALQNAGIAGTVVEAELGGGYTLLQKYDTELVGELLGGYNFSQKCGVIEPQVVLRKLFSTHAGLETRISFPVEIGGHTSGMQQPTLWLGTFATF